MSNPFYDILVIGGSATGLRAALEISKVEGLSCAVISKIHPVRSQTCMAQGGMNAALNNNNDFGEDSIETHFKDTVKGSDFLADQDATEFFCEEAPHSIDDLEKMGMVFSRNEDGSIAQRPFGGGLFPRTCYSRDFIGQGMLHTLFGQTLKNDIEVKDEWHVHSLIVEDNAVRGIIVFDIKTGELHEIGAKAVVMATGGAGNLYLNNVNAVTTTGDGIGIAYRAGANLKDMEFIQFHPTSLAHKGILITEGCRGEGGHLINKDGERFMKNYDSENMELSKRDIVSRAIQQEINEDRGISNTVLLDITHLGKEKILAKLPQVYTIVKDFAGLDCSKDPIPVHPAAHYLMGGIDTNVDCETSIKGLYAAGECSCVSIHGANRLGGNSLMETIVFGKQAGKKAAQFAENAEKSSIKENPKRKVQEAVDQMNKKDDGESHSVLKTVLQNILEDHAGLFRSHTSLLSGIEKITELKNRYKNISLKNTSKSFNYALYEALELENLIDLGETVLTSALNREESRGAHYRKDFPTRDNGRFLKHSLATYKKDSSPKIGYKDVTITSYPPF